MLLYVRCVYLTFDMTTTTQQKARFVLLCKSFHRCEHAVWWLVINNTSLHLSFVLVFFRVHVWWVRRGVKVTMKMSDIWYSKFWRKKILRFYKNWLYNNVYFWLLLTSNVKNNNSCQGANYTPKFVFKYLKFHSQSAWPFFPAVTGLGIFFVFVNRIVDTGKFA